ncbi:MAG: M20/M25/M40 family metallo-hydrolase [Enterobacterales bacterium]|nr:M20/M25/M40 family metallo-hydrolase [Enterobacterales bacterium]
MRNLIKLICLIVITHGLTANPDIEQVSESWIKKNGHTILNDFKELLSIPNVSSNQENMLKNAKWIEAYIAERGFKSEQIIVGGAPWILAERKVKGATKTVLFYAHYDGQPVQAGNWASPPFAPTLRDGLVEDNSNVIAWPTPETPLNPEWRLFARSAGDDKAPVIGLMAALDALDAAGIEPAVNIKLILDGEEEFGSDSLENLLKQHADALDADLMLFCDGPMHQSRKRQLVFGVRGSMTVDVTTYGPTSPLHSGHYGNWAPNPNHELVRLLSSLHNADGTIRVADFMADVIAPSQAELDAIKRMPDVGAMLQEKLNLSRTDLNGIRLEEAIMQPAIIIKGIDGGGAGPGKSRNIIQPSATASLNIRLVPGQTVARVMQQLSAHFEKMGYLLLDKPATPEQLKKNKRVLFLASSGGYRAYRSRMDSPEAQELSQLLKEIDGEPPLLTPTMGGSLPIYLFEEYLEMPIIIFPVANHDNNQHGRNENLRLQNLWDAIAAYAVVISEYSK